jgi:hypothetical protein
LKLQHPPIQLEILLLQDLLAAASQSGEAEEGERSAGRFGDRNRECDLADADTVTSRRSDAKEIVGWDEFNVLGGDVRKRKALAGCDRLGDPGN